MELKRREISKEPIAKLQAEMVMQPHHAAGKLLLDEKAEP